MVFIGVLVVAAVLAGLAVWAFRRRGIDEMHSVAGYQHRLERLEELRRRQTGSVRMVGGTGTEAPPGEQSPVGPVIGEDGRIEISSSPRRPTFDDTNRAPVHGDRPPPPVYRRRRDQSIARMSHRPRRLAAPIAAAVAVILLVTGLAIAGAHSRSGHSSTTSTTHATNHAKSKPPPTTTAPPPSTFTASSTSGGTATYALPFAAYTLTVNATNGNCWVQITEANGSVPYAQSLGAGQSEQIVLTGNSQVELGRPSDATVQVDDTPVAFPSPLPAPLTLQLNAGSTPGSTTTSTT